MPGIGKYALITGASSGIGWCISELLADRGYNIIAVSNQENKLEELKRKLISAYRVNVYTLFLDLSVDESARKLFDYCNLNGLEVEVLVNNAGTLLFSEVIRTDCASIKSINNLHMTTPALLCRLFGEKMANRRIGFIMNISSISAFMAYPGISFYGPTKTFLRSFTRALRTEMDRHGVNVTCLIPGATLTGLYDAGKYNTEFVRRIGILKRPDFVANAGVKALFNNRAECVPGVLNKIAKVLLLLIPDFIIVLIYRRTDLLK